MLVQSSEGVLGPVLATVDIQKPVPAAPQPSHLLQHHGCMQRVPAMASVPKAAGSWEQAQWEWLISLIYCC